MKINSLSCVFLSALLVNFLPFSSYADQEFTFDGGKYADFSTVVERNKARIDAARKAAVQSQERRQTETTKERRGVCKDGLSAGTYPCKKINMVGQLGVLDFAVLSDLTGLPPEESDIVFFNDIWGYSDRKTRREYALLGVTQGMIVIDITRKHKPRIVGILPSKGYDIFEDNVGEGNFWRDIKVYKHHAFIVSEQQNQGIQIFDLRSLRKLHRKRKPVALKADATYDKFSSAHNIAINEDSGFAYAVGTNTCLGGIEMVDISKPKHPKDAGCFKDHGYVHDIQCVNYHGPDERYHGREICFGSAGDPAAIGTNDGASSISITDVTDKDHVESLAFFSYGTVNGLDYSHQGWLTPNQRYFLHDDELDEFFGTVTNTTTRLWDVSNLTAPVLVGTTTNGATSIDHNLYTRGNFSIHSNYASGLRIFDATQVGHGRLPEVAFFDVRPGDDDADFDGGTWSNYPYFRYRGRNVIAVSSIEEGFFLLKPSFNLDGKVPVGEDDEEEDVAAAAD